MPTTSPSSPWSAVTSPRPTGPVLVRVHSECLTGDVFSSRRCDCGPQLHEAMRLIADEGWGVVIYLCGHEGRGIGIARKLQAYELQDQGFDTVDANLELGLPVDDRDYGIGAAILPELGVASIRLLTNNPAKTDRPPGAGSRSRAACPLVTAEHADNTTYLRTKRDRMGHRYRSDESMVRERLMLCARRRQGRNDAVWAPAGPTRLGGSHERRHDPGVKGSDVATVDQRSSLADAAAHLRDRGSVRWWSPTTAATSTASCPSATSCGRSPPTAPPPSAARWPRSCRRPS